MPKQSVKRGRPMLSEEAKKERREEIASVALRLFLDEGFASVSMRRLGKEVGLTPMALYRYYPSKLDILANLWGFILAQAFEQVTASTREGTEPEDALLLAGQAYVDYWRQNTNHYHLVFMTSGVGNSDVQSFVSDHTTIAHYEVFFDLVAKVRSEDRANPSVKVVTDGLICYLHGIMHSVITMQGYPWTDVSRLLTVAIQNVAKT